jgi:predicted nucleic acid-binding protein
LRWPILPTARTNAHWLSQRSVQHSRIVTTDEVLTEYLTFFSTAPESLRREAAEGVEEILASSVIRVIPQSRESFLADLQLYRARPDKGYSLVDCLDANDAQGATDRSSYQRPAF